MCPMCLYATPEGTGRNTGNVFERLLISIIALAEREITKGRLAQRGICRYPCSNIIVAGQDYLTVTIQSADSQLRLSLRVGFHLHRPCQCLLYRDVVPHNRAQSYDEKTTPSSKDPYLTFMIKIDHFQILANIVSIRTLSRDTGFWMVLKDDQKRGRTQCSLR